MQLTAEQLMELILAISNGVAQMPGNNKRKSPRVGMRYRVHWRMLEGASGKTGAAQKAWLRDVSSGGVGMIVSSNIPEGTAFVLELPRVSGQTFQILCMACHCRQVSAGVHQLGARYMAEWDNKAPTNGDKKNTRAFEAMLA